MWDKAVLLKNSHHQAQSLTNNNVGADEDTTIFIPLSQGSNLYVDGYILASISDTISTYVYDAKNYPAYGFGQPAAETTLSAEKIALLTMMLDANAFGDSVFTITDMRLFSYLKDTSIAGDPLTRTITLKNIAVNRQTNLYGIGVVICITYETEENYQNPFNVNCSDPNAACQWTHTITWEECYDTEIDGSGGGSSGGGGTTGGGTPPGGGNPTGGGGGGVGWHPTSQNPNPCDPYIATLQNDAYFSSIVAYLSSSAVTNLPYEMGYGVIRPSNYYPKNGVDSDDPMVDFSSLFTSIGETYDGLLHSHQFGGNSIFSPQDVAYMAELFIKNRFRDLGNGYFVMTSHMGPPYMLKISDVDAFRVFAQKIVGVDGNDTKLSATFVAKYLNKFNTAYAGTNEVNFMKMMQDYFDDAGGPPMILYRGTTAGNKWSKLSLTVSQTGDATVNVINCF